MRYLRRDNKSHRMLAVSDFLHNVTLSSLTLLWISNFVCWNCENPLIVRKPQSKVIVHFAK